MKKYVEFGESTVQVLDTRNDMTFKYGTNYFITIHQYKWEDCEIDADQKLLSATKTYPTETRSNNFSRYTVYVSFIYVPWNNYYWLMSLLVSLLRRSVSQRRSNNWEDDTRWWQTHAPSHAWRHRGNIWFQWRYSSQSQPSCDAIICASSAVSPPLIYYSLVPTNYIYSSQKLTVNRPRSKRWFLVRVNFFYVLPIIC